jgi:phosphoribosylpyrophosphate synthetase
MATNSIKLLTGNSHPALAKLVADRLGIELAKILVVQYSNQETSVTIGESVRDEDGMPPAMTRPTSNATQSSSSSQRPPARSTTA